MRAVNLARRPFVNRQPVLRLAGLLWLIGAILLLINFRLYSSYWQGSAGYRQQLAEVGQEIQQADQELNQHNPALTKVNLPRENSRTKFLNSLISYRTFPWSALFDDLEQVMPLDVRLTSVRPAVQLVVEPPKPRRRRSATPRRSTSRRARAAEARAAENAAAEAAAASTTEEEKTPSSTDLKRNEVMLDIVGVAKSQEALMGFIDTLYASPSFRNPFLPGETVNLQDGSTSFSIDVIYLTRPPVFGEEGASEDPEDSEAEIPGSAGEDGPEGSQTAVVAPALEPPGEGETGGAVGNPAGASPRVSTPAEAAAALRERAEQLGSTRQQGNERTTPSRPGAGPRREAAAGQEVATGQEASSVSTSGTSRRGAAARGTTGRSGTGRGTTGRSNTGRRARQRAGTLPPGSVPAGVLPPGTNPAGVTPGGTAPAGQGQPPAVRPPGAPAQQPGDGLAPPTTGTPPASATPRLRRGFLPNPPSSPSVLGGTLSTPWEASA